MDLKIITLKDQAFNELLARFIAEVKKQYGEKRWTNGLMGARPSLGFRFLTSGFGLIP